MRVHFGLPMTSTPETGGGGPLRPFHPERPRTGLFTFTRDPEAAPPITTYREVLALKSSAGLEGDALREFWDEVWDRSGYDLDALYPFIVRVCWRLTRGLATAKGKLPIDSFLSEMDQREWEIPTVGVTPGANNSLERSLVTQPCALMPPPPPAEWTDGSKDPSYYDPASDVELCLFVDRIGLLSRRLGLGHRKEGRLGLAPLLELPMVRVSWPTPREIMAYESVMIDEATQAVIAHGTLGARRELQKAHGFTEDEIGSLLLLARRVMRGIRNGADTDNDKAAMVARLEDLAARCRQNLDLRAELMVYKTLAVVQGITKTQGAEEDVDDMVDVAGEVSKEMDVPQLEEGDDAEESDE